VAFQIQLIVTWILTPPVTATGLLLKHRLIAHWRGSERFKEKVIKVKTDVAAVLIFVRYWAK